MSAAPSIPSDQIVRHQMFVTVDVGDNHNKFFETYLLKNNDVVTLWGRVGAAGQCKTYERAGAGFYDQKVYDKTHKRGEKPYTEVPLVTTAVSTTTVMPSKDKMEDVAVREIAGHNTKLADLVRYLVRANTHQILANTTLTYNDTTGLFATPVGVIDRPGLVRAQRLLDRLAPYVLSKQFMDVRFIEAVEEYLTAVPQDVGRKLDPAQLFPNRAAIKKQQDLLDALQASVDTAMRGDLHLDADNRSQVWDVEFDEADLREAKAVRAAYEATRKTMHEASFLKAKQVYRLKLRRLDEQYQRARSVGNIARLWHGTRTHNLLSIMSVGLVVPAKYANGWTYSPGIYFSDCSTKSLQYSYGYWSADGTRERRCFMLLADVALGKQFIPTRPIDVLPKGYDSVFAKEGTSGVLNNEFVIPRPEQCTITYLAEFGE